MSVGAARARAGANGFVIREGGPLGRPYPLTGDFRSTRITVCWDDDDIVRKSEWG
jgi:hypothetical protein